MALAGSSCSRDPPATRAGRLPPRTYAARWFTFDNATGATAVIGETDSADSPITAPPLPQASFLKVELRAAGTSIRAWETPVSVYFKRQGGGWSLVGLERMPDGQ